MRLDAPVSRFDPSSGPVVLPWLILFAGLCAVYVPSFVGLFNGIWSTDRQAHGPIMLGVALWLLYFKARSLAHAGIRIAPAHAAGWPVLICGLLFYVLGRSQSFIFFEVASLIPVLLGVVLIFFGRDAAKRLWFVFFFLLFVIPLPGSVVDAMTQPMKILVSYLAEHVLYWLGYPVARAGVVISIGPYQLLVADACAGLNSLFTLEALGLLYMNVVRHESVFRNAALALLIIPISLASNVTRVMVLSLITYHLGDAAGRSFLHGFSGMALFLTALLLIMGTDSLLRKFTGARSKNAAMRRLQGKSVGHET
ncbi:MAG: exosortase B [Pseudomonadota bacterium]